MKGREEMMLTQSHDSRTCWLAEAVVSLTPDGKPPLSSLLPSSCMKKPINNGRRCTIPHPELSCCFCDRLLRPHHRARLVLVVGRGVTVAGSLAYPHLTGDLEHMQSRTRICPTFALLQAFRHNSSAGHEPRPSTPAFWACLFC